MNHSLIKIGEHFFRTNLYSVNVAKNLRNSFQVVATENPDTDMTLHIKEGYGVPFIDFEVRVTQEDNKVFYKRADYLIEVTSDFRQAIVYVHDELALKHALMNLYSSFIVHHNWGLLIHSSCVIDNGEAHIFSGHSGAGKSTAAKLSYPRNLLSDEASIVKISSKGIQVFHSPFRSELESVHTKEECPLSSIQLLHQALYNNRHALKQSKALLELVDKVFFWPYKQEETQRIFGLLKQLVEQVPVYDLYFQKNNTFWELIS